MNDNANTQALPPGTRLEEFVIERVLGAGGFGITYLARDTSLNRQVVIKENLPVQFAFRDTHSLTVAPRHTNGEDADNFRWSLENFSREAETLASLRHSGIVPVLRRFEAFGTAYFVMPFIDGAPFDQLIESRRMKGQPFTEGELGGLLERMLDALDHIHSRGIYHRDIKPSNILITMEGIPVLIDFGSARQRLSERSMTVVESAGYTPFEQLESRGNVGPWSDLYALGATLHKALTGEAPPKAMDRMRRDPLVPLVIRPEWRGSFSVAFLRGIDTALRTDESGRWQDAREWRRALTHALPPVSHPQRARQSRPGTWPTSSVAGRRKTSVGGKLVLAGGALALGVGVGVLEVLTSNSGGERGSAGVAEAKGQAEQSGPAVASKETPFENSLGMRFVPIGVLSDGKPVLFSMWETRRRDYEAYAAANKRVDDSWRNVMYGSQPVGHQPTHPVVCVSWDDAREFCAWLTETDRASGKIGPADRYRLPMDAEWSFAVGIGDREDATEPAMEKDVKIRGVYPWGTQWPPPDGAGNYADRAGKANFSGWSVIDNYNDAHATTAPVGRFAANPLGLHDLGGNVWEWCEDSYDGKSGQRVLRGAAWFDGGSEALLSSRRGGSAPSVRNSGRGFRCVLEVSAP